MKVTAVDIQVKLTNTNPVLISKSLGAFFGPHPLKSVKKCRDGSLLITASDDTQYRRLHALSQLGNIPVKTFKPIFTPTGLEGLITNVPLDTPEKQIIVSLENFGVIHARRLTKKVGGTTIQAPSVKLVFDCEELPSHIYLGYSRHPVKPYVAPVLQCYKCRKFGHFSSQCRGQQRCARCGENHLTSACSVSEREHFKCINCGQNHSAAYGGCSRFQEAKEVKTISVTSKVSIAEAKKIVAQKSYASALSSGLPTQSNAAPSVPAPTPVSSESVPAAIPPSSPVASLAEPSASPPSPIQSVGTQTDPISPEMSPRSLETVILFFVKCISLLNIGSVDTAKVVMPLAQEMFGLDLLSPPVVDLQASVSQTTSPPPVPVSSAIVADQVSPVTLDSGGPPKESDKQREVHVEVAQHTVQGSPPHKSSKLPRKTRSSLRDPPSNYIRSRSRSRSRSPPAHTPVDDPPTEKGTKTLGKAKNRR